MFVSAIPCPREQFDAVIHLDHTWAVEPLERMSLWDAGSLRRPVPPAFDSWCQRLGLVWVPARRDDLPAEARHISAGRCSVLRSRLPRRARM